MKKLRDFVISADKSLIHDVLDNFDLKTEDNENRKNFAILKFEVISPDAFMWRILYGDKIYYLYAEDYIPGLDYVKKVFNKYTDSHDWKLVNVKEPIDFSKSSPVITSRIYTEPYRSEELMKFAIGSGFDFVFLCASNEDAEDARFSDKAPNGFNPVY